MHVCLTMMSELKTKSFVNSYDNPVQPCISTCVVKSFGTFCIYDPLIISHLFAGMKICLKHFVNCKMKKNLWNFIWKRYTFFDRGIYSFSQGCGLD